MNQIKEPTMEEILALVKFGRDDNGQLFIRSVHGDVEGGVYGKVGGDVTGKISGNAWVIGGSVQLIWGNVGRVKGYVNGYERELIAGRRWQFVEAPEALD